MLCFQDYPSVSQVAEKLTENNIQPIFAVTSNIAHVYTARILLLSTPRKGQNKRKERAIQLITMGTNKHAKSPSHSSYVLLGWL